MKMNRNEIDDMIHKHSLDAHGNRVYRGWGHTLDFLLGQRAIKMKDRIMQVDNVEQCQDIGPVVEVHFYDPLCGEPQSDFTLYSNAEFTMISTLSVPQVSDCYEVYLTPNGRSIKNVEHKRLCMSRELAHSQGEPDIDRGDRHLYYHLIFRTKKSFLDSIHAYTLPELGVVCSGVPQPL